jgi:hypothetical protein
VPRPRKGNPLGGPVRGIFISSPSHWPISATVEFRESGVEVLGGPVVERIIVIRGQGLKWPYETRRGRHTAEDRQGAGRGEAWIMA